MDSSAQKSIEQIDITGIIESLDNNLSAILSKAESFIESQDYEIAGELANYVINIEPQNAQAYNMLGCVCFSLGLVDKAKELFELAHSLDPEDPDISSNLSDLYDAVNAAAPVEETEEDKSMIGKGIKWIKSHTIPGQGIAMTSRQNKCYPEVTGYYIPTLLQIGERELAAQFAHWLITVQKPDGSFGGAGYQDEGYAFDTGQIIRGWVEVLNDIPEIEEPLKRACKWLMETADPTTNRLIVPPPDHDWSLGPRGEVNEGIHLYCLAPLKKAGNLLNDKKITKFVDKSVDYYLKNVNLTDFTLTNSLSHFYAYIQEALLELGHYEKATEGMASVEAYQQNNGSVPGYHDVSWVCSTGLAQLAQNWYMMGKIDRADAAMAFLEQLQNKSGGFYGSYGVSGNYFPSEEISWAVKYSIEASQRQITAHFDTTVGTFKSDIPETDGRVQAILKAVGNLNGKKLLDAGCGKGRYSALLKKLYPKAEIVAMDISEEMLKFVPQGIKTVKNGILNTPFANCEFDAIICVEALEHVIQYEKGVKELSRITKPGGAVVIIDKNSDHLGQIAGMPDWEKWFGVDELVGIMKKHGINAKSEFIGRDEVIEPDGLFVCWSGNKVEKNIQVNLETQRELVKESESVIDNNDSSAQPKTWKDAQEYEISFWNGILTEDFEDTKWLSYVLNYFDIPVNHDFGDDVLVDIGSGPIGGLMSMLKSKRKIAVEPMPFDIMDSSIERVQATGENTTLESSCADKVFMYNCLQHVISPIAVLQEIKRILKVGGTAYILEQLYIPTDVGHPHILKKELFEDWITDNDLDVIYKKYENDKYLTSLNSDCPGSGYNVLCMKVKKTQKNNVSSIESSSKYIQNFFRPEPFNEINASLIEAAKNHRYDLLISHLLNQDKNRLLDYNDFVFDEFYDVRPGMQALLNIFSSMAKTWHFEGKTRILELGTGGGSLATKLAKLGYNVTAMDASAPRIFANQILYRDIPIKFIFGVSEVIPIEDEHFDFIISQETLEHVLDFGDAMNEIIRVAKPGALFFHQVPDGIYGDGDNHLRFFTKEIVKEIFNTSPLQLLKLGTIPYMTGDQPNNLFIAGTIKNDTLMENSNEKWLRDWDESLNKIFGENNIPMLKHGGIEITNHCNLACPDCCTPNSKTPKGFANDDTVRLAIKYALPGQLFSLHRLGEPLLHPKVLTYVKWVSDSGLVPLISTNGVLLSEEIFLQLVEAGLGSLMISLHTRKSVTAFKMVSDYLFRNPQAFIFQGNLLSNNTKAGEWLDKLEVSAESRSYIRPIGTHTWAGNVPGKHVDYENDVISRRMGNCQYINTGACSVRWDGTVVSCCFDSENDNVLGHLSDFPTLKHLPEKYKLCQSCDPNWANGEMY